MNFIERLSPSWIGVFLEKCGEGSGETSFSLPLTA
jgi:hypothetical protein